MYYISVIFREVRSEWCIVQGCHRLSDQRNVSENEGTQYQKSNLRYNIRVQQACSLHPERPAPPANICGVTRGGWKWITRGECRANRGSLLSASSVSTHNTVMGANININQTIDLHRNTSYLEVLFERFISHYGQSLVMNSLSLDGEASLQDKHWWMKLFRFLSGAVYMRRLKAQALSAMKNPDVKIREYESSNVKCILMWPALWKVAL